VKLEGRSAIITGASQGLGREIARHCVREGANVAICARDKATLDEAADELRAQAGPNQKIRVMPCDVSSEEQVGEFARFALAELGQIQILVNNAGVYGPKGPTESVDFQAWKRAVEINLYGVILPCRALIPHFKTAGYGKIITLSGGGATAPLPFISSYAASKSAVVRLVETFAEELKPNHIDCNSIAPGPLNTRFLDEMLEAGPEKVGEAFYAKALQQKQSGGAPLEKGAELCVYLASAESDGITGRLISAVWDPWRDLTRLNDELRGTDIYTLRRIVPADRGKKWE
jgi:NAD(P)-dependent dehydrogenase (short-subunit alcohol dehydrogenase family)